MTNEHTAENDAAARSLAEHQTTRTVMGGWSSRNGKDSDRCYGWSSSCGEHSPDAFKVDLTKAEADAGRFRHVATRVLPPDECHNGHAFVPGVSIDHAPGESDPRWCNTCGETRVISPAATEATR